MDDNLGRLWNYENNDILLHNTRAELPAAKPADGVIYACAALVAEVVVYHLVLSTAGRTARSFCLTLGSRLIGRTPDFESGDGGSNPPFLT